jgi:NhaA family Na+:H+ antiporter
MASDARPVLAERIARPFVRFMELEVSSALLLVAMAALALLWANSPWSASYFALWHDTAAGITIGSFHLELSIGDWVNDGLMTIFFFLVGMEIKRELVEGELSSRARAMLPILGALGGMVVPAGIYAFFHVGQATIRGWGIPRATDIAFAVAALSLLGKRVPAALRVFLLALAIADDLGAVAVIAVFYTAEIHLVSLALAAGGLLACFALNLAGVRSYLVYVVLGAFVWHEMHESGVHATVAGVMLGFLTPTVLHVRDRESLAERGRHALERLWEVVTRHQDPASGVNDHGGHERAALLRQLQDVGRQTLSPVDFLTNALERWVAFVIMPLFALSNAGVALDARTLSNPEAQSVAVAVGLGLLIGKPIGVSLFSWVAVRTRIAALPRGVNWTAVFATGMLAGIGFTVALFVTDLAFLAVGDDIAGSGAKIGILTGSILATVIGVAVLSQALPRAPGAADPS